MFSELNSVYWVFAFRDTPFTSDWIGSEHKQNFVDRWVVPVPMFENKEMVLLRPGGLLELDGHLHLDEWTYLIGFSASESEAVSRAERLGLSQYFSQEFYDLLAREGYLSAVYVDEWWEFCPATDEIFARVKSCGSFREILPRTPELLDWTPQFV